jgi:hypothetical protein
MLIIYVFITVMFYTLAGWDRRGNEATLVAKWRLKIFDFHRSVVSHSPPIGGKYWYTFYGVCKMAIK